MGSRDVGEEGSDKVEGHVADVGQCCVAPEVWADGQHIVHGQSTQIEPKGVQIRLDWMTRVPRKAVQQ